MGVWELIPKVREERLDVLHRRGPRVVPLPRRDEGDAAGQHEGRVVRPICRLVREHHFRACFRRLVAPHAQRRYVRLTRWRPRTEAEAVDAGGVEEMQRGACPPRDVTLGDAAGGLRGRAEYVAGDALGDVEGGVEDGRVGVEGRLAIVGEPEGGEKEEGERRREPDGGGETEGGRRREEYGRAITGE